MKMELSSAQLPGEAGVVSTRAPGSPSTRLYGQVSHESLPVTGHAMCRFPSGAPQLQLALRPPSLQSGCCQRSGQSVLGNTLSQAPRAQAQSPELPARWARASVPDALSGAGGARSDAGQSPEPAIQKGPSEPQMVRLLQDSRGFQLPPSQSGRLRVKQPQGACRASPTQGAESFH